jgi:cation diffusion facilitator family transporter
VLVCEKRASLSLSPELLKSYKINYFGDDLLNRKSLTRFAWLSIVAALSTICLKSVAYLLTRSVGLLSDAVESIVNLMGALMALWMLTIAARPADESHMYGHSKAEYFASLAEGFFILLAAGSIGYAGIQRLMNPQELEKVGWGLSVSIIASVINFVVARILITAGKKYNSITLEADSAHLMTDVWTSAGVILAVFVVSISKWLILDPILALIVAVNIVFTGIQLIKRSISGLMDESLPTNELSELNDIVNSYRQKGVSFHSLQTRQSAAQKFISIHLLVPGNMTIQEGHDISMNFRNIILNRFKEAIVFTHLDPKEDNETGQETDKVSP